MASIDEIIEDIYASGCEPDTILEHLKNITSVNKIKRIIEEFQFDVTYNDNELVLSARRADIIELLLDYGADPRANNDELLVYASSNGCSYNLIKRLLESGADVNVNSNILLCVISKQNDETLKLVLDYGANIKKTHICFASRYCKLETLRILLYYLDSQMLSNMCQGLQKCVEKANLLLSYNVPAEHILSIFLSE